MPISLLGIFLALASAGVWGAGDFTGGRATRRQSQYQVLASSALSGLVVLAVVALATGEAFPSPAGILWSVLAGFAGALGIAAFYRALSTGHNAIVAPTTGVVGAALPVVFGGLTAGLPAPTRLAGFGLALVGIWLVSSGVDAASSQQPTATRRELLLAALAGVGFGGFFIFIGLVEDGLIFTPLILSRSLTFATGLALTRLARLPIPAPASNPLALLAGVLDASGNLLYILAKQYVRLDVAAVLASLYPASTVLLAALVLKEKVTLTQAVGIAACLSAIALIVL